MTDTIETPRRAVEILLVEDNPGDVVLTLQALEEGHVTNHVTVARDGQEAMDVMLRRNGHEAAPRPDVVLLDLNLPRMHGREVLAEVKAHPDLRRIPVVVLTTSDDDADVLGAYDLYANSYVTKPLDIDQFLRAVRSLEEFWLEVVRLPLEPRTS